MSDKMPAPSRDLIEHMLRAMGWTFRAPYWWDPSQNRCLVGLGSLETEFGRTYAQALRDCGEGHLRMAGIDPNAWEKTR